MANSFLYESAEKSNLRLGALCSAGLHLFLILFVAVLAWITGVKSLADLMSAAVVPPPPDQQQIMEIELDEQPPPPPPDVVDFQRQHLIVKNQPPPPPPPPKPKPPPPKPVVRAEPPPAAPPHELVVGSGHFPQPTYPPRAKLMRISGTVVVNVHFDGSGGVGSVDVESSSGSSILDSSSVNFIRENWHDASWAGKSGRVPIRYQLIQ